MAARSGKALLAGVIGYPVSHSLSPALHEFWLRHYNIDGAYIPLSIAPDTLQDTIKTIMQLGFQGFNVTLPHKEAIIPFLTSIDASAQMIGAVNTVVREGDELHGLNTDTYGCMQHLKQCCAQEIANMQGFSNIHALVLGAGGASRAVCAGLIMEGCHTIYVANRNKERAISLVQHLQSFPTTHETNMIVIDWEDALKPHLDSLNLIINTTQLGMQNQPSLDIDFTYTAPHAIVYDIVYRPLITPLLHHAQQCGLKTVDGLGMLLWQAQKGFELWFHTTPEITTDFYQYMSSLAAAT